MIPHFNIGIPPRKIGSGEAGDYHNGARYP